MTNTNPTVNQYYTVGDISFIQEQFNAIEIPEEGDVWTFQNIVDELSRILAELNDLVGSPTSGAPPKLATTFTSRARWLKTSISRQTPSARSSPRPKPSTTAPFGRRRSHRSSRSYHHLHGHNPSRC